MLLGTSIIWFTLQDQHRDDLSLDGRMSSSSQQTHHSDEMNVKLLNGSVSSRGSSPGLEADEPPATRACIMRTLSIVSMETLNNEWLLFVSLLITNWIYFFLILPGDFRTNYFSHCQLLEPDDQWFGPGPGSPIGRSPGGSSWGLVGSLPKTSAISSVFL